MNTIRNIIRTIAIIVGLCIVGFYGYTAITDVSKADTEEVINSYSSKCHVSLNGSVDLFAYVAANSTKEAVEKLENIALAEFKFRTKQGNFSDMVTAAWFQIEKSVGYNHEQRIFQIGSKAGIKALKDDFDKCKLPAKIAAEKKFAEEIAKPVEQAPIPTPNNQPNPDSSQENDATADQHALSPNVQWKTIQDNPSKFLDQCAKNGAETAKKLGGMTEADAQKHAAKSCDSLLSKYKTCMSKEEAKAEDCLSDEGGD